MLTASWRGACAVALRWWYKIDSLEYEIRSIKYPMDLHRWPRTFAEHFVRSFRHDSSEGLQPVEFCLRPHEHATIGSYSASRVFSELLRVMKTTGERFEFRVNQIAPPAQPAQNWSNTSSGERVMCSTPRYIS